jgi:RNA polymerase sigma-70 factor (ECF subfamily)
MPEPGEAAQMWLVPLEDNDLERFRSYLELLARLNVETGLRDKLDLSGVVQQTMLEAYQELKGTSQRKRTHAETAALLRSILSHNLADGLRRLAAQKRDASRVRSLESALDESAARLGAWLATCDSSPSQKAIHHEELLRMVDALTKLPESQRRAIEMHHLEGQPLAAIAQQLGSTKAAVAGLLHRGIKTLRRELEEN